MKRVNIQFDEASYEIIKTVGFLEKKSFAEIVREGMAVYLEKKKHTNRKLALLLEPEDQKTILKTMQQNTYISQDAFNKNHGFS